MFESSEATLVYVISAVKINALHCMSFSRTAPSSRGSSLPLSWWMPHRVNLMHPSSRTSSSCVQSSLQLLASSSWAYVLADRIHLLCPVETPSGCALAMLLQKIKNTFSSSCIFCPITSDAFQEFSSHRTTGIFFQFSCYVNCELADSASTS